MSTFAISYWCAYLVNFTAPEKQFLTRFQMLFQVMMLIIGMRDNFAQYAAASGDSAGI